MADENDMGCTRYCTICSDVTIQYCCGRGKWTFPLEPQRIMGGIVFGSWLCVIVDAGTCACEWVFLGIFSFTSCVLCSVFCWLLLAPWYRVVFLLSEPLKLGCVQAPL